MFTSYLAPIYSELKKQFEVSGFSIWNNHWSEIHNFTKKEDEIHFVLKKYSEVGNGIEWQKAFEEAELEKMAEDNFVPFVYGDYPSPEAGNKALLIFNPDISADISAL